MEKFKFINRGFDKTLLLLPGWACDWRIFTHLDLPCDYIFALSNGLKVCDIADYLKVQNLEKISILGFSMGSFLAADFAEKYQQSVDRLLLISSALKPDPDLMEEIKRKIEVNPKAFLYRFYLSCFAKGDREGLSLFRRELMDDYLRTIDKDGLVKGLERLEAAALSVKGINNVPTVIYHGREDKVFPLENISRAKTLCRQMNLTVADDVGHIPFFNQQFLIRLKAAWKN